MLESELKERRHIVSRRLLEIDVTLREAKRDYFAGTGEMSMCDRTALEAEVAALHLERFDLDHALNNAARLRRLQEKEHTS